MIMSQNLRLNVPLKECIPTIFQQRKCVKIMRVTCSAVWAVARSFRLGKTKTVSTSGRGDLIKVL